MSGATACPSSGVLRASRALLEAAVVLALAATSVYWLELDTGKRQLVSVDRWGGRNDRPAGHPLVNADGTVVAFESASPDLVEGDTDGVSDVFLRTVQ